MDEPGVVAELDPLDHLVGQHQDGFEREFSPAVVEELLKVRTQGLGDHDVLRVDR